MKNAKRVIVLLLCAVLLVGASVAGTLAFLTSQDEVTNTFTVGNVQINLDEPAVEPETGKVKDDKSRTEDGNKNVRMIPGRTIDKEPTVTVLKDSEDCYVRVKVTVDVSESWTAENAKAAGLMSDTEQFETVFTTWANDFAAKYIKNNAMVGFNAENWTVSNPTVNLTEKTITYMLTYRNSITENIVENSTSDTELAPIFTDVVVPNGLTNAQLALLAGMEIKVEAHAIQAEGFEAETEPEKTAEQVAWDAFAQQMAGQNP